MKRRVALVLFAAGLAAAQTNRTNGTRVWFHDGTCIEIHSEASGKAPLYAGGSLNLDSSNTLQRLVLDEQNRALFGYDVEARAAASPGSYTIRILPLDSSRALPAGVFVPAGARIPTLAGLREFAAVKSGEAVKVDILYNPTTGEKIYDVLQPWSSPADEFRFDDLRVRVNSVLQTSLASTSLRGTWLLVHVPAGGEYVLALEPVAGYGFEQTARVEGDRLSFQGDGQTIELVSRGNILSQADSRPVWVYRKATSSAADAVESALRNLQILTTRLEMERLERIYKPEHPRLRELTGRLAALQAAVNGLPLVLGTYRLEEILPPALPGPAPRLAPLPRK